MKLCHSGTLDMANTTVCLSPCPAVSYPCLSHSKNVSVSKYSLTTECVKDGMMFLKIGMGSRQVCPLYIINSLLLGSPLPPADSLRGQPSGAHLVRPSRRVLEHRVNQHHAVSVDIMYLCGCMLRSFGCASRPVKCTEKDY